MRAFLRDMVDGYRGLMIEIGAVVAVIVLATTVAAAILAAT